MAAREHVPDLAERYTRTSGDSFAIDPALRDCVVFARHNVIEDPPFPQLHLVSCRNVLIYSPHPCSVGSSNGSSTRSNPMGCCGWADQNPSGPGATRVEPIDSQFRIYRRSAQNVTPSTRMSPAARLAPGCRHPPRPMSRVSPAIPPPSVCEFWRRSANLAPLAWCWTRTMTSSRSWATSPCTAGSGLAGSRQPRCRTYARSSRPRPERCSLQVERVLARFRDARVELPGGAGYVHLQVRRLPVGDRLLTRCCSSPTPSPRRTFRRTRPPLGP